MRPGSRSTSRRRRTRYFMRAARMNWWRTPNNWWWEIWAFPRRKCWWRNGDEASIQPKRARHELIDQPGADHDSKTDSIQQRRGAGGASVEPASSDLEHDGVEAG